VTGTLNRPQQVARMVESLRKHETSVDWELIVANAGDQPVPPLGENVRVIEEKPRLGWTRGYNNAFSHAKGRYFCWINDDVEWIRPVLPISIALLNSTPRLGIVGIPFDDQGILIEFQQHRYIPYASFGVMEASLFRQVRGFDERLWMYGCDNSIAFRVLMVNRYIRFLPRDIHLYHHRHPDEIRMANERTQPADVEKLDLYYSEHYERMRRMQKGLQ
jgi:GT2 family glycosyltransferase